MTRSSRRLIPALAITSLLASCFAAPPVPEAEPGSALPGLGPEELGRFQAGRALFNKVFTPDEGVGPFFNENQCSACHTFPAAGGNGEQFAVRAARIDDSGTCDPLSGRGGDNVRQQATPPLRARGVDEQSAPAEATTLGRFMTPFLFGLGLIEAIPDQEILARDDPDDADGNGISGRAAHDAAGRLARFGRKAEHADIRSFVDGALRFEMGLTTPMHPGEGEAGGAEGIPAGTDPAPDPEISRDQLDLLVDYVRFLAAPARSVPTAREPRRLVEEGEELFHRIGCSQCHVPFMDTGPNAVPALDHKRVYLYSDLLLHDLGPGLADVCGRDASPAELRTAPLMGVGRRDRNRFLHDGRARSLDEAIRAHDGEAAHARALFGSLSRRMQEAIVRFLQTL